MKLQKHFTFREYVRDFISVMTKPDIAASTDCYKIGWVIIHFVMVYMMYLKRTPVLRSGFTTTLAAIAITLPDKTLKSAGKFWPIGKRRNTPSPVMIIHPAYLFNTFRWILAPLQTGTDFSSHFRRWCNTLIGCWLPFVTDRQFLSRLRRCRFTLVGAYSTLHQFREISLCFRLARNALIPSILSFLKATTRVLYFRTMPHLKSRGLTHTIDGRYKFTATTGTKDWRQSHPFGSLLGLINSLTFSTTHSHSYMLAYSQCYVKGGD